VNMPVSIKKCRNCRNAMRGITETSSMALTGAWVHSSFIFRIFFWQS